LEIFETLGKASEDKGSRRSRDKRQALNGKVAIE
jgi:hypothetical protein